MLSVSELRAGYGQSTVLHDVALDVPAGSVVCLLGRNGMGKTTLLKSVMGLIPTQAGQITLAGRNLSRSSTSERARAGLGYVPQGRGIFPYLTVEENLLMGFEARPNSTQRSLDEGYELFPVLRSMRGRPAGRLSGGQQQQLALARALVGQPSVLLLDEPTEGIQPSIIWEIERAIDTLRRQTGLAILLVEQFVEFALGLSDSYFLIDRGIIVSTGPTAELTESAIRDYLAV